VTRARQRRLSRIAVAGQGLLIALCTAWALFERPAPIVNIDWREGLSAAARRQAERDLSLEFVEDGDEGHYELGSPRQADIAAIVAHPDVEDTHRIDREHATLTADADRGILRVWWAGPFKGVRGRAQFRVVLVVIGVITLLCAWLSNPHQRIVVPRRRLNAFTTVRRGR
jgi:hypothetical protein